VIPVFGVLSPPATAPVKVRGGKGGLRGSWGGQVPPSARPHPKDSPGGTGVTWSRKHGNPPLLHGRALPPVEDVSSPIPWRTRPGGERGRSHRLSLKRRQGHGCLVSQVAGLSGLRPVAGVRAGPCRPRTANPRALHGQLHEWFSSTSTRAVRGSKGPVGRVPPASNLQMPDLGRKLPPRSIHFVDVGVTLAAVSVAVGPRAPLMHSLSRTNPRPGRTGEHVPDGCLMIRPPIITYASDHPPTGHQLSGTRP